jgi:hypothetical protein
MDKVPGGTDPLRSIGQRERPRPLCDWEAKDVNARSELTQVRSFKIDPGRGYFQGEAVGFIGFGVVGLPRLRLPR